MRLSESTIKAAILHPEEEVRLTATRYFSGSVSQDETIMPLVVQAVERHGRSSAFHILREAEHLPQSPATTDWLISELRRDYDLEDLGSDNYRFAVALILYHARPELLLTRQGEIALLPTFPAQMRAPLQERIDMLTWGWDRGWAALGFLARIPCDGGDSRTMMFATAIALSSPLPAIVRRPLPSSVCCDGNTKVTTRH